MDAFGMDAQAVTAKNQYRILNFGVKKLGEIL